MCEWSLEEALAGLRLERLRERAELLQEEHRLAPRRLVRLLVRQLGKELRKELIVLLHDGVQAIVNNFSFNDLIY